MTPVLSVNTRNGRRTGVVTTKRITKRTYLVEGPIPYVFGPIKEHKFHSKSKLWAGGWLQTLHHLPTATNVHSIDITLLMPKTAALGPLPEKHATWTGTEYQSI